MGIPRGERIYPATGEMVGAGGTGGAARMSDGDAAPGRDRGGLPRERRVKQHSLGRSVLLHLMPGAALTLFILLAVPLVKSWGFPAAFALFIGIPLVIVPIELGYLLYQARHGEMVAGGVVGYREKLPARRYASLGGVLTVWWILVLFVSVSVIDEWIAGTFFWWVPEFILEFSTFEEGEPTSPGALLVLFVVALVFNGFVGPVVEELYFRGHLLPAIERLGIWAPVLNTVLFSVYHFWTPWQNPGRIVAMLPLVYGVWRTRSVYLSIIVHVTVNNAFLLLVVAVFL